MHRSIHSTAFLGTLAVSAAMLLVGHSEAAALPASQAAEPLPLATACIGPMGKTELRINLKSSKQGDDICVMRGNTPAATPKPRIGFGM